MGGKGSGLTTGYRKHEGGITINKSRRFAESWKHLIYFNDILFDGEVLCSADESKIIFTRPNLDDRSCLKIVRKKGTVNAGHIIFCAERDQEIPSGFIPYDQDESDEDIKICYFEDCVPVDDE